MAFFILILSKVKLANSAVLHVENCVEMINTKKNLGFTSSKRKLQEQNNLRNIRTRFEEKSW